MKITLDFLVQYVRGLDTRLSKKPGGTVEPLSDEEIIDKIDYGIANMCSECQPFEYEETFKIDDYLNYDENLSAFVYTTQKQSLGILRVELYEQVADGSYQPSYDTNIKITQLSNNDFRVEPAQKPIKVYAIRIKYLYVLDIKKETEVDVEPEIWHFMKHSIQIVVWGGLKDYEKEQYHQKVLDAHISRKILQPPFGLNTSFMKGGFV